MHHTPAAHHTRHHGTPDPLIYPVADDTGRRAASSRAARVANALILIAILTAIVLYLAIKG